MEGLDEICHIWETPRVPRLMTDEITQVVGKLTTLSNTYLLSTYLPPKVSLLVRQTFRVVISPYVAPSEE
jgi:hypothetical protein